MNRNQERKPGSEAKASALILGGNGQVGRALAAILKDQSVALTRSQIDLGVPSQITRVLDDLNPKLLINAAAYTQVDRAEEEKKLAFAVNATAPGIMAQWCAEKSIPFVHFSTDYVFPGTGRQPWTEEDDPSPLNVYGMSKLGVSLPEWGIGLSACMDQLK